MKAVQLAVFIICFIGLSVRSEVATIGDMPQFVYTTIGSDVVLSCPVLNWNNQTALEWDFYDHDIRISNNTHVYDTSSRKYRIRLTTETVSSRTQYNFHLIIKSVERKDVGKYVCQLRNTSASRRQQVLFHPIDWSFTTLLMVDADSHQINAEARANFSQCCYDNGVRGNCLKVCSLTPDVMRSVDVSMTTVCLPVFEEMLTCGSDGRIHVPCCRRRGVPDVCLPYCSGHGVYHLSTPTMVSNCMGAALDILQCFIEGQGLLPNQPQNITGRALPNINSSTSSIEVRWDPPTSNWLPSSSNQSYRVFYTALPPEYQPTFLTIQQFEREQSRLRLGAQHGWEYFLESSETRTQLTGLKPDTFYVIGVAAYNRFGASDRSRYILVRTESSIPLHSASSETITGCCSSISSSCRQLCHPYPGNFSLSLKCYGEMGDILQCVGKNDNHTDCCRAHMVPRRCWPMCSGRTGLTMSVELLSCLPYLADVYSCFLKGGIGLRGPASLQVYGVSIDGARLSWTPANSNQTDTFTYLVRWGLIDQFSQPYLSKQKELPSNTTETNIGSLQPDTEYYAEVMTKDGDLISGPSPIVAFRTYDTVKSSVPAYVVNNDTYQANMTACCIENGVTNTSTAPCLIGCDLDVDLSAIMNPAANNLAGCLPHLPSALRCATDRRDHTECCMMAAVPQQCVRFCGGIGPDEELNLTLADLSCTKHMESIIGCIRQGIEDLPLPPTGVRQTSASRATITIDWDAPNYGPARRGFIIEYRPMSLGGLAHWKSMSVSQTVRNVTLPNLRPPVNGSGYEIRLISYNSIGRSQPSYRIIAYTLPEVRPTPPIRSPDESCCETLKSEPACYRACRDGRFSGDRLSSLDVCTDWAGLLRCAPDANTSEACCAQRHVSYGCRALCRGDVGNFSLCVGSVDDVLSCVFQSWETVPSPPEALRLIESGETYLVVGWKAPANGSQGIRYKVQWTAWRMLSDRYAPFFAFTKDLKYNITKLQKNINYYVTVKTYNNDSSSSLNPTVILRTVRRVAPTIKILPINTDTNRPLVGPSIVGMNISLTCDVVAEPPAGLIWKNGTAVIGSNHLLTINNLQLYHSGVYTCQATNSNGNASRQYQLTIAYKPSIARQSSSVTLRYGRAYLFCSFVGVPDYWHWKHAGYILDDKFEHYTLASSQQMELNSLTKRRELFVTIGLSIIATANISQLVGDYSCYASNRFGIAEGHSQLVIGDSGNQVAPKPSSIPGCCRALPDVDEKASHCLPVCQSKGIIIGLIEQKLRGVDSRCWQYLPAMLTCKADGHDHSLCCLTDGVPDMCLPLCYGQLPSNPLLLPLCMGWSKTILHCLDDEHDVVPSSPIRLSVSFVQPTAIVTWQKPLLYPEEVANYTIFHGINGSSIKYNITVAANQSSATIQPLIEGEGFDKAVNYYVYMVSNSKSSGEPSDPSLHSTFRIPKLLPPAPPLNLEKFESSNGVLISWDSPQDDSAISSYLLRFKPASIDPKYQWKTIAVFDKSYLLVGLQSRLKYQVEVRSVSYYGQTSSKFASMEFKFTRKVQVSISPSTSGEDTTRTIVVVIVVVAGILLLVGLVAYCGFSRRKEEAAAAVTYQGRPQLNVVNDDVDVDGQGRYQRFENPIEDDRPLARPPIQGVENVAAASSILEEEPAFKIGAADNGYSSNA